MTTSDLESGYHQVPIHPDHRRFLGVQWTRKGKTAFFVWNVLFLGIETAVHLFTKLLRPHVSFCQQLGIPISIYIYDQRVLGRDEHSCLRNSNFAAICLRLAGWIIKPGKGMSVPTQYGTFLGLDHDLKTMQYFIPIGKLTHILSMADNLLKQRRIRIKDLASFYGKISSCRLALGPISSLLTRSGHALIADSSTACGWEGWVSTTPLVFEEIYQLRLSLPSLNGWPILHLPSILPHRIFACDASAIGIGAAEIFCHFKPHPHPGACSSSVTLSKQLRHSERETSSLSENCSLPKNLSLLQQHPGPILIFFSFAII
ncbi:uncharacterized protein LOC131891412 [Tigriopus californicus]|uniref:uncharacterized protein LOC131891412 n=1 Tax=Tigriopus californicus TaxID=6832 RepID=UPI0027DA25A5|nr:uncharacterized protein LOC131891412 [Tigriopus californicus]XP_059096949.1 uncharacterized protein LOC131891412 [Tigriopus californicus]